MTVGGSVIRVVMVMGETVIKEVGAIIVGVGLITAD